MDENNPQENKTFQGIGFDELADAPVDALGLSTRDADALKQALDIKPSATWPRITKEKAERWTHLSAFALVSHGSKVQLLPHSLNFSKYVRRAGRSARGHMPITRVLR